MIFGWLKKRRRKKILAQPWLEAWSLHLNRNVRLTWRLSEAEMSKLQRLVQIFVAEKNWEGCEGLEVTEEMKVTIAASASLMLLGVEDFYFDNVRTILIYPKAFSRQTSDGVSTGVSHRAGEAWQGGPIILSWRDTLQGARNEDDGRNLVVHEFAHALDGLDGSMGGNLIFSDPKDVAEWGEVVESEFQELVNAKETRRRTLLDHYGATNLAEFFAVASETFFEQPSELKQKHSKLFELLIKYYHVDPRNWQH